MKCAFIADTGTGDINQRLVGKGLSELVKNKDIMIDFEKTTFLTHLCKE